MSGNVYDLKQFYASRSGRLVRRLLQSYIHEFWPDLKGQRILGYGYGVPYLKSLQDEASHVFALMPAAGGVHHWQQKGVNKVAVTAEDLIPLETESVDMILMVHGLENAAAPEEMLAEMWRVLKSNGRMLVVVPNRLGMWARVEHTPFGHGKPYTSTQLTSLLNKALFVCERKSRALYMPPFKSFLVLRSAYAFESFGKYIFPGLSGLHVFEVSKQVYAGALKHEGKKAQGRRILLADSVGT